MININGINYDTESLAQTEDWASVAGGKTQAQVKREAFGLYVEAKRIEGLQQQKVTEFKTEQQIAEEKELIRSRREKNKKNIEEKEEKDRKDRKDKENKQKKDNGKENDLPETV